MAAFSDALGEQLTSQDKFKEYKASIEGKLDKVSVKPGSLESSPSLSKCPKNFELKKELKGHIRKVAGFAWGTTQETSQKVIAADQGGKVIIWDAKLGMKEKVMSKTFIMSCGLHPDGKRAFIGGMDNLIYVYDYQSPGHDCSEQRQLAAHDGYIATIKFPNASTMVTSGGDADIIKWDTTTYKPVVRMAGHHGDASSLSFARDPNCNPDRFVTCSCDKTCRVWDLNSKSQTHVFALSAEANACAMFPNSMMVAAGCHDGKCFLFDLRSSKPLQKLARKNNRIAALDFSSSGRVLMIGYEDGHVGAWDPFKYFGDKDTQYDQKIDAHFSANNGDAKNRMISALEFSHDGSAFATTAFDSTIKIWAPKKAAA